MFSQIIVNSKHHGISIGRRRRREWGEKTSLGVGDYFRRLWRRQVGVSEANARASMSCSFLHSRELSFSEFGEEPYRSSAFGGIFCCSSARIEPPISPQADVIRNVGRGAWRERSSEGPQGSAAMR